MAVVSSFVTLCHGTSHVTLPRPSHDLRVFCDHIQNLATISYFSGDHFFLFTDTLFIVHFQVKHHIQAVPAGLPAPYDDGGRRGVENAPFAGQMSQY
jgi:hypothetical protein